MQCVRILNAHARFRKEAPIVLKGEILKRPGQSRGLFGHNGHNIEWLSTRYNVKDLDFGSPRHYFLGCPGRLGEEVNPTPGGIFTPLDCGDSWGFWPHDEPDGESVAPLPPVEVDLIFL